MRSSCCNHVQWSTLETWVKAVAIFEMMMSIMLIVPLTSFLINLCIGGTTGLLIEGIFGVKRELQFTIMGLQWIIVFINFVLSAHLFMGGRQQQKVPCQIWITVNAGCIIMFYLWNLMSINFLLMTDRIGLIIIILVVVAFIKGLEILIIVKFLKKLKSGGVEIYAITPSAPTTAAFARERVRSELDIYYGGSGPNGMMSTTGDEVMRRARPCSTFRSPSSALRPQSIDLQAVNTNPYPNISGEMSASTYQLI